MLNQVQHDNLGWMNVLFVREQVRTKRTREHNSAHFAHAHGMGNVGTWASVGKK
ncbi:MAG: hypothetical protein ACTHKV_01705 [Flavipsychrobacter sp.]